jgi:hypothetical protein
VWEKGECLNGSLQNMTKGEELPFTSFIDQSEQQTKTSLIRYSIKVENQH